MPYIKKKDRKLLDCAIDLALEERGNEAISLIEFAWTTIYNRHWGCLNYVFTQLFRKTNTDQAFNIALCVLTDEITIPKTKAGKRSYTNFQDAIGMLVCMEDEFQRRIWGTVRTRHKIKEL